LQNKEIFEWDCWEEENINSPNYQVFKKLNLDNLPNYDTKYNGKIYLHMDTKNSSAAWFFITYLIYAFANKISRFSKKCYGQNIKYGKVKSNNLKYKAPPQSEKRRAYRGSQFITLDNMHKGSFLEIVVLNVPDGRKNVPDGLRQEFQRFINQMDQNQEFDANFERLIWRDVETRLS
jgi:hypothetical protein